jgi:peptide/nickel transport system substrate-binding protein
LERGGWSIFHTLWKSRSMANPALNSMIRGQGRTGFFGWYESAPIEQLTQDWLQAGDEAAQQALVDRIQTIAFEDAPSVPLGIFMPKTAYRSDISGIVPGPSAFPWSVRRG